METKKWYVREIQIVRRYWEYEVEAETEEEAEKKVKNGEVKEDEYYTSEDEIVIDEMSELD